jgi:hypothetical protein
MQSLGNYGSDSDEEELVKKPDSPHTFFTSSIQDTGSRERELEGSEQLDQQMEEFMKELQDPSAKNPKSPRKRSVSPHKRKFEAIQLEIVDETREATVTEKVALILRKQGYVASNLPKETSPNPDDPLVEKIALWSSVREQGLHFNQRLLNTHAFCNPLIMNKMISYMELDENGTNFPAPILDPATVLALPSYTSLGDTR